MISPWPPRSKPICPVGHAQLGLPEACSTASAAKRSMACCQLVSNVPHFRFVMGPQPAHQRDRFDARAVAHGSPPAQAPHGRAGEQDHSGSRLRTECRRLC